MSIVITTYYGHSKGVFCLDWSPDGKWLVSGSHDATAQVWEAQTGNLQAVFRKHALQVMRVAWSPNKRQIASSGFDDEVVYVWEAMTGELIRTYTEPVSSDECLTWSPGGQYLVAGGYQSTQVWRVSDQQCIAQYPESRYSPTAVAWSPVGSQFALANGGGNLYIRDFSSGHLLWQATAHMNVTDLEYSPDGQFLASSGYDATVQVRESSTGKLITLYRGHPPGKSQAVRNALDQQINYQHPTVVWSISWSPDSRYLASASGNTMRLFMSDPHPEYDTVQVWEATTGRHIYTYPGHTDEVRGVAWSPDGCYLASASLDRTVHVWDAPT